MTAEARRRLAGTGRADPDAVAAAAIAALEGGFEDEAIPDLEAAVAAHPGDARLWQLLGLAYRGTEDLRPAVEALERAARLAPADALIAHGRARAMLEAGLPAVAAYDRAVELAPGDISLQLGRSAAQVAEGGADSAISGLEAALRRHPGWVEGQVTLARLRWMFDGEGFTRTFEAALADSPRDLSLWKGLLDTLVEAERYEQAAAAVARGRAAAGASPLFDGYEADCASETGDLAAADRLFARLWPPADVVMAVRNLRHLLRSGRPDRAAAVGEALVGQAPAEIWPYLSLAWRLTGNSNWQWLEGDPAFVGVFDISDRLPPLGRLADCLRRLHVAHRQPLEQSVRGGTQTDGPLFSRIEPEIRALRRAIVETVERYVAQLPPPVQGHPLLGTPRGRVRFAGSWSVRLARGGRHANHHHPAGWISSALYVALPPEGEGGPPPAGWLALGEPQDRLRLDLPALRTVEPKPGRLVLFPSTMWHGTIPFGGGERLTVAFDVAPPRSRP